MPVLLRKYEHVIRSWPAVLLFGLSATGFAQTLREKVEALLTASPVAQRGHWGAQFVDLGTGEVIYARNENSFFVPASNTKLFSTALALTRLGPAHRQATRLVASQALDSDGVLRGDLRLIGGGDATLSGRTLPYEPKTKAGEPLAALDELAEQAAQSGLRRVEGDLIGDDSTYMWEPFPDGWAQGDITFGYGAPVSALMLHDNTFTIRVEGGLEAGEPARIAISPSPGYWTIESRIRTALPATGVKLEREPGSRQIELWGTILPKRTVILSVAVDDPAYYAAFAMREALERHGISVLGGLAAFHRHPLMNEPAPETGEVELARRLSPPLVETLRVINKVSQNLQAEGVLLEVARVRGKTPGRAGAVEELRGFLEAIGIPGEDYNFEDASGLSRLTLITPSTVIRLLRFMHGSPAGEIFRSLLPRGGFDGTLEQRFKKFKGAVIMAKTGSLSHTAALAGYIDRPDRAPLAFSVMLNNANSGGRAMREFIDKLVITVLE
jgi:D-alanyl-D-alanine carboxypeptidase/D-alanyl-D-alanine-endopeptidase (penicillin-binding protein 4)